jgi:hypothetical protein
MPLWFEEVSYTMFWELTTPFFKTLLELFVKLHLLPVLAEAPGRMIDIFYGTTIAKLASVSFANF